MKKIALRDHYETSREIDDSHMIVIPSSYKRGLCWLSPKSMTEQTWLERVVRKDDE